MSNAMRSSPFASRCLRKESAVLGSLCHLRSNATMTAASFPRPLAAMKQQYIHKEKDASGKSAASSFRKFSPLVHCQLGIGLNSRMTGQYTLICSTKTKSLVLM